MKRVAEKQLIKDDGDMDGDEGDDVGKGFKRADESVLATRKIRALPKRTQASAAGSSAPAMTWSAPAAGSGSADEPAPVSKFSGFTGFGAAASSKSFTFAPSTSTAASNAAPPSSSSLFGGSTLAAAPSTTAGASSTAKTFASFLGTASNGVETKPAASSSEEDKPAVAYYSSLRGLNVSFLKAINKYIEEDPFVDISELLERYKSLRTTVQKEFDSKPGSTSNATSNAAPAPSPPKTFTMPVPPSSTTSLTGAFKLPPSSTSSDSSAPLAGGFVFKATSEATTSPFTLPSSSKPSETSSSPSPFSLGASKSSTTTSSTSSFTFGGPPKDTASSTTSSPFTFGTPAKETTSSSSTSGGFAFGAPAKDTGSSSSSTLGGFSFGAPAKDTSSSSSSTGFSFGAPAKDTSSSTTSPFTFGAPPKPTSSASSTSLPFSLTPSSSGSSTPKSIFSDNAKSEVKEKPAAASNPFGMPSSTSTSSPFGTFGKPPGSSGSLGNPVGFGFGAAGAASGGDAKSGFSFGSSSGGGFSFASSLEKKKEDSAMADEGTKKDEASAEDGAANPVAAVFGANPHDEEGEGEEEEESVHSIKSKAYRMKKADEKGGVGWVEIGYGILRLKKHKETDARRMLLRNSTTGKININFKLYSGLKPSQTKKAVTFVGHDNGTAQTYSIRVGTEEQAKELKEAIDREIAAIKAKE
ncbi:hypothetical protein EST38_g4576 [Candolleomyces aberdarensis]|uniref:RanBD1 domain-containing protein n=1 Tax=Candolleomyces aberdarensis TaxID=2316362 RepID=A0A4Q2DMN4_9AGAR|nr:hypothetical protein EST38_g4576 [Candolleomyces aberdarensis]